MTASTLIWRVKSLVGKDPAGQRDLECMSLPMELVAGSPGSRSVCGRTIMDMELQEKHRERVPLIRRHPLSALHFAEEMGG